MKGSIALLVLAFAGYLSVPQASAMHMANGIKIGEVTSSSAIIWTRLTAAAGLGPNKDRTDESMRKALEGVPGEIRLKWWASDDKRNVSEGSWQPVDPDRDHIRQFSLTRLKPGTAYSILAEGRSPGRKDAECFLEGSFRTAPAFSEEERVSFTVVTGQEYSRRDDKENGHKIYPQMLKLNPSFFVHTGDIEYYDKPGPLAKTPELARFKWNRVYALPYQRTFHNVTASYFIKDDHDTLKNDCWPGQTYGDITWEEGLAIFKEQVPMGGKTYRTIRWGRDLQIWLVEGRDFRSPNTMPDGPKKTIWGAKQKQWFFDTVKKSDATFRILISPTPVVGPDRGNKNDNHANKGFTHEGDELRSFIGKQKNMLVICGDRHWQYVSEDPRTGVREYSCGPTSNAHAGGFKERNKSPMHRYLKVKGGFLSVVVERDKEGAMALLTHHGVDGTVYNRDVIKAK